MNLSELLVHAGQSAIASVRNEKEFDIFARITTETTGRKCVFVGNRKYIENIDSVVVSMVITTNEIAQLIEEKK